MKILVANLGSTSFKYRLFDMADERQLARGGVERIGSESSPCFVEIGGKRQELKAHVPDHAVAVQKCLEQLTDRERGCLKNANEVSAIGFKAVHAGAVSGVLFAFCLFRPFDSICLFFALCMPAILFAVLYVAFSIYAMKQGEREGGMTGGIAHEAHLGGALGGLVLTILLEPGSLDIFLGAMRRAF